MTGQARTRPDISTVGNSRKSLPQQEDRRLEARPEGPTPECELAVCIVNHNHRDLLPACIESTRTSAGALSHRIVVLDNCSTDGSVALLRGRYPDVEVIECTERRGFAANQNVMLRQQMERARYVMMLNDDTVVESDCLRRLVELVGSRDRVGAVGAQLLWPDGRIQISATAFPSIWREMWRYLGLNQYLRTDRLKCRLATTLGPWGPREVREYLASWVTAEPRPADALCGGALLFRTDALREVGLLDEHYVMYLEDVDWCRRAWKAGWECWLEPRARVLHHGGASASAFTRIEWERSALRYFSTYHPRYEVVLLRGGILSLTFVKMAVSPVAWLVGDREAVRDSWVVYRAIVPMCLGLDGRGC